MSNLVDVLMGRRGDQLWGKISLAMKRPGENIATLKQ